jgi:hypothetical protein
MNKITFKKGKMISIAACLFGLLLFSVLTIYVLSESEKKSAEQLVASAEESLTSLYETMQTGLKGARGDGILLPINESALASAQLSLNDAEKNMSAMNGANKELIKEDLLPKMKKMKEYNRVVPLANQLQNQIHDINKNMKDDPFNSELSVQLSTLKNELAEFSKAVKEIEDPIIKEFFHKRYEPQITLIEEQMTAYRDSSNQIKELRLIAEKLSLPQGEFDQKVSRLSEKVGKLPDSATKTGMEEEIKNISLDYERNQLAAIQEKKRLEEKRKAEEEQQRLEEEKRKAEEEQAQRESEEVFPMEFVEISPNGHKIINSRRPYNDESFYKFDEIAKKHGGRYYYTPNSDVAALFNKERKAIAFINYGFSTNIEYKELFVDLYVYYTGTSKGEAAKIVQQVIDTGEPVKTGEGNGEGSILWTEDGRLHYDLW